MSGTISTESLAADIVAGNGRTPAQVARRLPASRIRSANTTTVNPSTIFRWIVKGVTLPGGRVVKLQAIRVAGRFLTTDKAVAEFFAAQTGPADPSTSTAPRPTRERRAADADAARQLERFGI